MQRASHWPKVRVRPDFRFNQASARAWIEDDFRKPGR